MSPTESTAAQPAQELVTAEETTALTQPAQAAPVGHVSPLVSLLAAGKHSVDEIERLLDANTRWEKVEAEKAFFAALSRARAELPTVQRSSKNEFLGNSYATLDDIIRTITPVLSRHGLSVSWQQSQEGQAVRAVCVLTHELGHSTSSEMIIPITPSKGVNVAQITAIASTYARRYSLTALLGIATSDNADADGAVAGAPTGKEALAAQPVQPAPIAEPTAKAAPEPTAQPAPEQNLDAADMADIEALCTELGRSYEAWLNYLSAKTPVIDGVLQVSKATKPGLIDQIHRSAAKQAAKQAGAAQ